MSKYILINGQSTDLAQAEIWSVFHKKAQNLEFKTNFTILDSELSAQNIQDQLGGTIKVAEYLKSIDDLGQIEADWWTEQLNLSPDHKANFGFSLYNSNSKKYLQIKKTALNVKKELKKNDYKARLVTSQEMDLSSVVIKSNHLLDNELLIIQENGKYILAITRAIQDFADYAERDMNRPGRDDRSGMLPPKVAKMMINLLSIERKGILLDPFCGSGTILQEAVLLGYKKINGTDSSPKAITDSQKNIDWLREQYDYNFEIKLTKSDVKELSRHFPKESIDHIVSEPFMGPAQDIIRKNDLDYFYSLSQDLFQLYNRAFQEFAKILKPQARIIFVFPLFNIRDKKINTLDIKRIEKNGFKNITVPINLANTKNGQIVYQRPGQKVFRQITIWEKI